jgi:serine acetyltransferase
MGNPDEKRHPTIGDNVHLGAFVQVLGNISIGNNAIVGPGIKVTQSIPSHSTLIRHTEYYILRRASEINFFTL